MLRENWRDRALCRTVPDLPWIAEPSEPSGDELAVMEAICGACMVCFECLECAGYHQVTAGFWAGAYRSTPPQVGGEVA